MKKLNKKIKASSMVEVLMALLIISISLGAIGSIYVNIFRSSMLAKRTLAHLLIEDLVVKTKNEHLFFDEDWGHACPAMHVFKKIEIFSNENEESPINEQANKLDYLYKLSIHITEPDGKTSIASHEELFYWVE